MAAQGRPMEQRDEDWEYLLEKLNIHLEQLVEKANREKAMLMHMTHHYMAQNMSSKARIKSLKVKLKKVIKRQKRKKEKDQL